MWVVIFLVNKILTPLLSNLKLILLIKLIQSAGQFIGNEMDSSIISILDTRASPTGKYHKSVVLCDCQRKSEPLDHEILSHFDHKKVNHSDYEYLSHLVQRFA